MRGLRDLVRSHDRRQDPDRSADPAGAGRDGRLRRTRPHCARRGGIRRPRRHADGLRHRGSRQERLAVAGRRREGRSRAHHRRRPCPARGRPAGRQGPRGRGRRSPTPATRSPSRPPSSTRADPPTSPWSASTCPGCEGGAILSTAQGGTVIFFSMATSFTAAALGAEGLASDVTMLVGNGYVPGHADYAVDLVRTHEGVRALFESRLEHEAGQIGLMTMSSSLPKPARRRVLLRGGSVYTPAAPFATAMFTVDGVVAWVGEDAAAGVVRRPGRSRGRPRRPPGHARLRRRPRPPGLHRLRAASPST